MREFGPGRPWTASEDRLLGKIRDDEAAKRWGRTSAAVAARRLQLGRPLAEPERRPWSKEQDELLGTGPDREVGRMVGRGPSNVAARRRELGIKVFDARPELEPRRTGARWTEEENRLLGSLPDRMLARRFQRTLYGVIARRRSRE